ncbi:succinate dehydrogenase assembly factor 2 [Gammaproteobacteria bacterium]|nr:succinate dehydrogenase assembly factor 2 [bacterium]MDA7851636.1 succinate dehydrogenase assembly factor 2 [Gammaproteobacteria bacterium]MDA8925340.1 succinate dehydrogenase assembly factor 2 [Gammaproteobacteria bacterium]MDA9048668.1 succinate dehydrogenase assembly factor 2 [Gammaproteobacteria bacterium]MDA9341106.1 succinate dehydrogenase assembly factor 2 [Gammaproteobacteria bacterium]|tara:strand:- start:2799 stop:3047 length:249 start_codon:yes stop_codon:yes gene_type:complete
MNTQINKTKWKCRRGLRELDLLFRKFSGDHLETLSKADFDMFNSILDLEDQPLYDFIFKGTSIGSQAQEDFILLHIKKFIQQ